MAGDWQQKYERMEQKTAEFNAMFGPPPYSLFPQRPQNNPFINYKDKPTQQQEFVAFSEQCYPIVDGRLLPLMEEFIEWKKTRGSAIEKIVYETIHTPADLIHRLLTCRPLVFYNSVDTTTLRNGRSFNVVIKDNEVIEKISYDSIHINFDMNIPLNMYMSYDEALISALIGVSNHTHFINKGDRDNFGRPGPKDSFQPDGIYVGLVGARCERNGLMERQLIVLDKETCIAKNGYGKSDASGYKKNEKLTMWAATYSDVLPKDAKGNPYFPSFEEVKEATELPQDILKFTYGNLFLNGAVYKLRLELSFLPFFAEANARGEKSTKNVYAFVVGLGLGVWKVHPMQPKLLCEVVRDILLAKKFEKISKVIMLHMSDPKLEPNDSRIVYENSDPAGKVPDNILPVAMYAWDGVSFPGNEYWVNALNASGDPAAACCSEIVYLQNPYINPNIAGDKTYVCNAAEGTMTPIAKLV